MAKQDKTSSSYRPSVSSTPLEVFVTVNLKAKTLKRVLAKIGNRNRTQPWAARTYHSSRIPWHSEPNLKPESALSCHPLLLSPLPLPLHYPLSSFNQPPNQVPPLVKPKDPRA